MLSSWNFHLLSAHIHSFVRLYGSTALRLSLSSRCSSQHVVIAIRAARKAAHVCARELIGKTPGRVPDRVCPTPPSHHAPFPSSCLIPLPARPSYISLLACATPLDLLISVPTATSHCPAPHFFNGLCPLYDMAGSTTISVASPAARHLGLVQPKKRAAGHTVCILVARRTCLGLLQPALSSDGLDVDVLSRVFDAQCSRSLVLQCC